MMCALKDGIRSTKAMVLSVVPMPHGHSISHFFALAKGNLFLLTQENVSP